MFCYGGMPAHLAVVDHASGRLGKQTFMCKLAEEPGIRRLKTGMLAKLGQRFNSAGVISTLNVMLKERHLALPHLDVPDASHIDWRALRDRGFQGVVLDKDNTITAPYKQILWPSLFTVVEECKGVFDGRVAILSNSAGLYQYDPHGLEAISLESAVGIPVIRHGSKKPAGSASELEKHFECDASTLVMVGDRYFTDIVYGNKNGLLTIITKPLSKEGEPIIVRMVRRLEEHLVHTYRKNGIMPPKHRLMCLSGGFVKNRRH